MVFRASSKQHIFLTVTAVEKNDENKQQTKLRLFACRFVYVMGIASYRDLRECSQSRSKVDKEFITKEFRNRAGKF